MQESPNVRSTREGLKTKQPRPKGDRAKGSGPAHAASWEAFATRLCGMNKPQSQHAWEKSKPPAAECACARINSSRPHAGRACGDSLCRMHAPAMHAKKLLRALGADSKLANQLHADSLDSKLFSFSNSFSFPYFHMFSMLQQRRLLHKIEVQKSTKGVKEFKQRKK